MEPKLKKRASVGDALARLAGEKFCRSCALRIKCGCTLRINLHSPDQVWSRTFGKVSARPRKTQERAQLVCFLPLMCLSIKPFYCRMLSYSEFVKMFKAIYETKFNVQNEKQGILLLISRVLAIEDEEFMQEDRFWGRLQDPFLAKILWVEKWRLSLPLVLPQPSLAPWGASVVTLATEEKRCTEKLVEHKMHIRSG